MKRPLALLIVLSSVGAGTLMVLHIAGSQGSGSQAASPAVVVPPVVLNEVAWMGTACSAVDEWIELYNNTSAPVDLADWTLRSTDGSPDITLQGTIPAHNYFLLERQDDGTVSDLLADLIYSGALANVGESLELRDAHGVVVDTANGDGGGWPGGIEVPRYSMERLNPSEADSDANWGTNDGITRNGRDCLDNPLNGTPKAPNSVWSPPAADLSVDKRGPATALPGALLTYTLAISNAGQLPAESVRLTDTLPAQVEFLTHTAPYPFHHLPANTLVWEMGTVPTITARAPITFNIAGRIQTTATGQLANAITATTTTTESHPANNHDTVLTAVANGPVLPPILIEALYYDGHADRDHDEAFRLVNVSAQAVDLSGWSVTDQLAQATATFPPGTTLVPGEALWCTWQAARFREQFGFQADFELIDTEQAVPEMTGSWPGFANSGGACLLRDASGRLVDALVYGGGTGGTPGWEGSPVEPWSPTNSFGIEGQILYRKRDQVTGLPTSDTGTAADWAQDPADAVYGRKVQYPGWDLEEFFWTTRLTETAVLTVAVGPDHLLETVRAQIEQAQESIWIETYTLESSALAQALIERLAAGVSVTILLEGGPVGGIEPAQRWLCGQIALAGGQIYFMYRDTAPARYRFQHAKVILVDDRLVLIGTENLNPSAMPADNKEDGTAGRRGIYLITNAPGVVGHVQALLAADIDPDHHGDLVTCARVPELCIGTQPLPEPNWTSYTVAFTSPLTVESEFGLEVIQSPENSLRTADSLLGLIGQAGSGDTILVEQFYEQVHWGPGDGTPDSDPNLRLAAYLDAARRGATVRILLNDLAFAGYENENEATAAYLRSVARREGLDLQVRLGNPTHMGVHNKMILAHIGGRGFVHVGSINGSEVSSKINRELALQVQSDAAHEYLREVFDYDWRHSHLFTYLPLVQRDYEVPIPADRLLVSELLYAVSKEEEWIEILNPTDVTVDLSDYAIGDADWPDSFEGMYRFPAGASLGPRQVLVIATSAATFRQTYGRSPTYEFYETDPEVPTLAPAGWWGTGEWELRNSGDEVLILDQVNHPVEVVVYGDGEYLGVIGHPGVSLYTHSLERYPALLDTDDCSQDFRDWPFPNPGELAYP